MSSQVGSVDNEGGESEMCKTAFYYEIVCITVIRWAPAHCSMCQSPRWAISETVGRPSLFLGTFGMAYMAVTT